MEPKPEPDDFEVEESALFAADAKSIPSTSRRMRPSRLGRRAGRVALAGGAFLIALVVVLGSLPAVQQRVGGIISSWIPTPTATLAPGSDQFYLETDVPWTSISLDGQAIRPHHLGLDQPLRLTRGYHYLEWRAAPFQPQHCTVFIPQSGGVTCSLEVVENEQHPAAPPAQIIFLHESLDTLAPAQQQALLGAIQAQLSGFNDTLQPGELAFMTGGDTPATQPLRVTFELPLDTESTSPAPCTLGMLGSGTLPCTLSGQSCFRLCTVPWPSRSAHLSSPSDWLVLVVVQPSWAYARQDGTVIAHNQPVDSGLAAGLEVPTLLRITWGGLDWHVQALLGPDLGPPMVVDQVTLGDDPTCVAAEDVFSEEVVHYAQLRFVSGLNPARGCLVIATVGNPSSTPAPANAPVEQYLVRCGEFLAVNALAHQRMPYYSQADVYERSLAQQLAALPGGQVLTIP